MRFRPCIDIHNGKVKQIIGGSLRDSQDQAEENYVAAQDAAYFARLYKEKGLRGGHVILLNHQDSEYYEATRAQAFAALAAFPGGLQAGGGIRADNAREYLDRGASHVIVTSYVFRDGQIAYENLEKIKREVGREHLVLDLSCRKKDGEYYVVTDRWQRLPTRRSRCRSCGSWGRAVHSFWSTRWMWKARPRALTGSWWACWPHIRSVR